MKYKIGQTIWGNGNWRGCFPKGTPWVIKEIKGPVGDRGKYEFLFTTTPPASPGGYWGYLDTWFTTEEPAKPKKRVIRD